MPTFRNNYKDFRVFTAIYPFKQFCCSLNGTKINVKYLPKAINFLLVIINFLIKDKIKMELFHFTALIIYLFRIL